MNGKKNQRILLIGGRQKAAALAHSLLEQGCRVTAINCIKDHCSELAQIDGLNVVFGDGTKPEILEEAGASRFDAAIVLTPQDADNLIVCRMLKALYGVKKIVSLVNDPNKTELFRRMGADGTLCAAAAMEALLFA